jgi:enoyl-CoA hydratase
MTFEIHEDLSADGVCTLTLDRPPANALNAEFLDAIESRFVALEIRDDVRAVVITGRGKIFSAGMDLKIIPGLSLAGQRAAITALNKTYGRLYGFPKPLVAAVNGHAIAGGLFFVLASDYRVGPDGGAQFGLTEVRAGVAFPVAALDIAKAELSPAVARRLLLGGRTVGIGVAADWGILDEVVQPGDVLARALEQARLYAATPPKAYAAVKCQLRAGVLARIERVLADGGDPLLGNWITEETAAAAHATLAGGAQN